MTTTIPPERRPRILLADDHPAILKAVAGTLNPQFEVVAAVNNGKAALEAAAQTDPDVVVTDIAMPVLDGIRLARALVQKGSRAKIVFLTGQEDDDYISEALNTGSRAYVVKRRMQTDLLPALNSAMSGIFFVSPYAFASGQECKPSSHILELYLDEQKYFDQVSERTYRVLASGEQVFMFLSKIALSFVTKRLSAFGVNWFDAIKRGQFRTFSVENIVPLLMQGLVGLETIDGGCLHPTSMWCSTDEEVFGPLRTHQFDEHSWPDLGCFQTFFWRALNRAAARAREQGSQVTILSNLIPALIRQGCGHDIAVHIE